MFYQQEVVHEARGSTTVYWFCYGIDPLVCFLEKRLRGISIYSTPAYGPCQSDLKPPVIEESYKLIAYVDDLKPAITAEDEFLLVDMGSLLFEKSSGCELHRDPSSGKVKFLSLGKWRGKMKQQHIPLPYIILSDHLDMLGLVLKPTYSQTRKVNCDEMLHRFSKSLGAWKSGNSWL